MARERERWRRVDQIDQQIIRLQRERAQIVVDVMPDELRAQAEKWLASLMDEVGEEHEWKLLCLNRDGFAGQLKILRSDD